MSSVPVASYGRHHVGHISQAADGVRVYLSVGDAHQGEAVQWGVQASVTTTAPEDAYLLARSLGASGRGRPDEDASFTDS